MGAAGIEIESFVNRRTVEQAYAEVMRARERGVDRYVVIGRRAANARDPKLLTVLERGAVILQQISEEQAGPHGFDVGGIRVQHTEFQMWRNAYLAVDKRVREDHYEFIYAMAALLAGFC